MTDSNPQRDASLEHTLGEETLVIAKPEAMLRGISWPILQAIEYHGFMIRHAQTFSFSRDVVSDFYGHAVKNLAKNKNADDKEIGENEATNRFANHYLIKPSMLWVVRGLNAIQTMRNFAGGVAVYKTNDAGEIVFSHYKTPFEPVKCPPGTYRGDYFSDDRTISNKLGDIGDNGIHTSENVSDYNREIGVLVKHQIIEPSRFIWYTPCAMRR